MSRKKNPNYPQLPIMLSEYCANRTLDFKRYSPYHMRLMDGGFTVLDVWTSSKYYVLQTDYTEFVQHEVDERSGEKGSVPIEKDTLFAWLDSLFFPEYFL